MKKHSLDIYFHLQFTLLALLAFGQLGRISLLNQQVNFYAYEIILLLYFLYNVGRYKFQPIKQVNALTKSLLIFLSYLSISWLISLFLYSPISNVVSSLYLLRLWLYGLFFVYLLFEKKQYRYSFPLYTFIGLTIITSIVQYFLYPDLRNLEYLGWDPHLYRMFGLFFDPPIAAGIYGLALVYIWFNVNLKKPYLKIALCVLLVAMIVLTYSRGSFLGLIVIAIIYALRKGLFKQLGIGLILFVCVLFFLPRHVGEGVNLLRTSTIESRVIDYEEGIKIWEKSPILGIGYNHIRAEKTELSPEIDLTSSHAGASFHSSFLIIVVTGGVIGLSLFLYFLLQVIQLSSFSFYSTLLLAVMSLTDNVLLHNFILCLWFVLIYYSIHPSDKSR